MNPLLDVKGLKKTYRQNSFSLRGGSAAHYAVKDVSFSVSRGETVALVGESGAGKSTVGRMVLRLIEPDSGTVIYDGKDVLALKPGELRRSRARMQMIFQDPYSSLDPKLTIADSVAEPLRALTTMSRQERDLRVQELLLRVGLGADYLDRYPYELSGGQLQRVAIARAISTNPGIIVCDEPVAALDMSIRAQVLNLLKDLQIERGISYIFISHDLSLVSVLAHRVAVMRAGEIVEEGSAEQLFSEPGHAYTRELLQSVPSINPRRRRIFANGQRS